MSKTVLFICGVSGAGKTETLKCLEDMGYDCIDNMPLRLIPTLLKDVDALPERLVIAVDGRNADIRKSSNEFVESIFETKGVDIHSLFLCCEDAELIRRFKETRRSHPSGAKYDIYTAIQKERKDLTPFRERAQQVVDTSEFSPKQLWQYIRQRYQTPNAETLQVYIMSFGYKHGMPREADYVFDVRYLRNPYWDADLRNKTGLEEDVRAYVEKDDAFEAGIQNIVNMVRQPLNIFKKVDRSSVTIAIGCTGGQHRSVTVVNTLTEKLSEEFAVHMYHRDVTG